MNTTQNSSFKLITIGMPWICSFVDIYNITTVYIMVRKTEEEDHKIKSDDMQIINNKFKFV